MQAWHTFLLGAGTIRQRLDLDRLYTTALVEGANAFDADAVRAAARAYAG